MYSENTATLESGVYCYRTAENFDREILMSLTNLAIHQNFTIQSFLPIAVCIYVAKSAPIHQNFTCQIFPVPQFVKIFHHQNFVPYSIYNYVYRFEV